MTVQTGGQVRAQRECDECHETDDLPHHQVVVQDEGGLRMVSRHFECCAARGCPDGTCARAQTGAPTGV